MATTTVRPHSSIWPIVEYQLVFSRRAIKTLVATGLITPLLYVLSLGVGLGTVVNSHGSGLGVPYLVYVAPAFLAATALQIATGDASYPIFSGFQWTRTFHGMAASPLTPRQIALGQLTWIALRITANAMIYLAVMACFGACRQWQVIFAIPAATLTGTAFAATVAAVSASLRSGMGGTFATINRFLVTPMFLFSGTFYPISRLPQWARDLAYISPLWHGTELARDAAIGGLGVAAVLGHLVFLLSWLGIGIGLAVWRFRVRLTG